MANVVKETVVKIDTNKGKLVFPIFYIDEDIIPDSQINVSSTVGGGKWYPQTTPRSVWASENDIYTEFESKNGSITGKIENNLYAIRVYNENGGVIYYTSYSPFSGSGRCGAIGYQIYIGTNNVPACGPIAFTYQLSPDADLPVLYNSNSSDSFGTYSRPNYAASASMGVSQGSIDMAIALLRGASIGNGDPYEQDPNGPSGTGGGGGSFDNTSTPIEIPNLPSISASSTGFISLFNPTLGELNDLASYLWSDLFEIDGWKKLFADPMDAILGLSIVPVAVPSGGAREVKVGNIGTGKNLTVAASQFVEVDCGSIDVNEYWGAYLDYEPYTQAQIFLPYIGIRPISVDEIMGKTVRVVYHVDILTGACCCFVKCGDSVLYTYNGQCSIPIPITGANYASVVNGVISIAASVGSLVATGGSSAPTTIPAIASSVVNQMKPQVEKSGSISGSAGVLNMQTPYLILIRPRQALPSKQNEFIGYPSLITVQLTELSGYTEVQSIHLENIPATQEELAEIESLLKGGVIF